MKEGKVLKRQYTQEYKLESARLAQSVGINEAARRLGLPSATLGNWKRLLEKSAVLAGIRARAYQPGPQRPVSELEAENSRLRKELASARLDVEILGKATTYFSKGLR
ncbi:hypothetical protein CR159_20685 [Pollutimonas subterranea]|uniref:Transposase n=1 Tax=Pollutimonas subterranea TaxID=2045210 RepID=A0A2N4TYW3_9BURK|nr:hypothetical protein CR159_20685 [Pollutimonas subterranea]